MEYFRWIVLSASGILLLLALSSCFSRLFEVASLTDSVVRYENAGKYTAGSGSVAKTIDELEINWVAGQVELLVCDGDTVEFSETSEQEIRDAFKMRFLQDEKTLYLQYAKSGRWKFGKLSKKLTVKIPRDLHFSQIRIHTVSAGIQLTDLQTDTLKIETVSGYTQFSGGQAMNTLSLETVSGKADISLWRVADLIVNTVSGSVKVQTKVTRRAKLDSVSAALTLFLPPDSSFSASIDTVSGSFTSDFETVTDGRRRVCAGGEVPFDIDTVSGDVFVRLQDKNN